MKDTAWAWPAEPEPPEQIELTGNLDRVLEPGERIAVKPWARPAGWRALEIPDQGLEREARGDGDVAMWLDSACVRLAAARDLIPGWTAELLRRLEETRGYQTFGRSSIRDYAREELGLTTWQVSDARRLGRSFARLPALRTAVLQGRLTCALANKLARRATTDDDVAQAIDALPRKSVRAWEEELDAGRAASDDTVTIGVDDEAVPRKRVSFRAPASFLPRWRSAIEMVRDLEGAELPTGEAVECVAAEWMSSVPLAVEGEPATERRVPADDCEEAERDSVSTLRRRLEDGTDNWAFFCWELPRAELGEDVVGELQAHEDDAHELHRRLAYLQRLGQELDWQTGRVLSTLKRFGVPRTALFASFSHYVTERLRMSPRRAYYLVDLHRRLVGYRMFEEAYRTGELSWSQVAVLVRSHCDTDAQEAWIARAHAVSVSRLEEDVTWARDVERCNRPASNSSLGYPPLDDDAMPAEVAPPDFVANAPTVFAHRPFEPRAASMLWPIGLCGPIARDAVPIDEAAAEVSISFWLDKSAATIVAAAIGSIRAAARDDALPEWRAFETMIEHFAETHHESDPVRKMRRRHRVFERDGWRCQMPGCRSSGPLHAHHIVFRSRGGSDDDSNLLSLCFVCHQTLVHDGRAWVAGQAPDRLRFGLGVRPGGAPVSLWIGQRRREWVGSQAAAAAG